MIDKQYYVYILANKPNGTLYIGVTNHLIRRVFERKEGKVKGFAEKYKISNLVYFEIHHAIREAIIREKQIKKWNRDWKINLIEQSNPQWLDLYSEICK